MTDVVIAAAARTPVGAFNGGLSTVPASYLGEVAIREAELRLAEAAEQEQGEEGVTRPAGHATAVATARAACSSP